MSRSWPARHAACLLRGKRRAGLRRWQPDPPGNAPVATATKRPSSPAQCPRCLRLAPSLRFRPLSATAPFAPKDGAKGLRLRAGCAVPNSNAAGCCATGSVAPVGLGSLRCRLRGGTGRPGIRPACRAAARRCAFPPACVCGFVYRSVPPAQPGSVVGNST